MARRERGAYPLRYVTSEERSQQACEPQPTRGEAAGRHLLRCRSSTMHWGIDCVAAPCICLPGARAKMESFRWDRTLVYRFKASTCYVKDSWLDINIAACIKRDIAGDAMMICICDSGP